jgi:hypothetical protein
MTPTEQIAASLAWLAVSAPRSAALAVVGSAAGAANDDETVGVDEAARILHTTRDGVYSMRARGKMPPPLGNSRRLVWRRKDLLASGAGVRRRA